MFNTRSRPRSEWLIVLEWSWGGVALGGTFGAVFERFSGVLKRSWGVLERLGVILGRLGTVLRRPGTSWGGLGSSRKRLVAILEPSWGVLRPSWDHLGATLGRPWVVLGLFWAVLECSLVLSVAIERTSKIIKKTCDFCLFFEVWGRLGRDLVAVLGRLGRS